MKSKRTSIELIYLWWHRIYGNMLVLCLLSMLFNKANGYILAYGLIPQGVVQVLFGAVALFAPKQFRLKKRLLLWLWAILSALILISLLLWDQIYDLHLMQSLAVLTLALPLLQFLALTSKKFKH